MPSPRIDRRSFLVSSLSAVVAGCAPRATATRSLGHFPSEAASAAGRTRPERIVVIGAGLSGLSCAYYLERQGLDVVVLEAQSRVGGRIETVRDLGGEGTWVETGATHVVGDTDLLALIRELGVALTPRTAGPPPERKTKAARLRFRHGTRRVLDADLGDALVEARLTAEERAQDEEQRLDHFFAEASRLDPHAVRWSRTLAPLDDVTAAEWLRARGASPALVASYGAQFAAGDGIESVSALSLVREVASFRREATAGGGGRIAGGTDHLPNALARALGGHVHLDAKVVHLEPHDHGVGVVVESGGTTERIEASRVVVTLPFTVFRHVTSSRAWSGAKARAIAEFPMTSVTRLHLGMKRRFWELRGDLADADSDLAVSRVRDETYLQSNAHAVLGVYLSGFEARRWNGMTRDAAVAAALSDVDHIHPGSRDAFDRGHVRIWDDHPFARGAYAWFRPGQLALLEAARAPEHRVHFAGDGLSHRPGFMHGALSSAKRVVAEILEARELKAT